jgi:hypothetical protein
MQSSKDKIVWECNNGGQVWTAEAAASSVSKTGSMPGGFCAAGFNSLNTAFIISLLVDIACQVSRSSFCVCWFDVRAFGNGTNRLGQIYMYFLAWRFSKRLEHYSTMKGPFYGGTLPGSLPILSLLTAFIARRILQCVKRYDPCHSEQYSVL